MKKFEVHFTMIVTGSIQSTGEDENEVMEFVGSHLDPKINIKGVDAHIATVKAYIEDAIDMGDKKEWN